MSFMRRVKSVQCGQWTGPTSTIRIKSVQVESSAPNPAVFAPGTEDTQA